MKRLLLALFFVLFAAPAFAANVGFALLETTGPAALKIGVWYPTKARPKVEDLGLNTQTVAVRAPIRGERLPLVVISHGTGGWLGSHIDTAKALAAHGYVAVAVSHAGDTYDDRSRATQPWIRTGQIKAVVDYMLGDWPDRDRLDPGRIGLFGFSAGGLTALGSIGGVADMRLMAPHCQAHPAFYDCRMVARAGIDLTKAPLPPPSVWVAEPRIRAAVIAAPGLGFVFRNGLKDVTLPVQLWRAEHDSVLPETDAAPDYALAVRDGLGRAPEYHVVAGADHYDFLTPCNAAMTAETGNSCKSPKGFDRAAFHARFNKAVVRFFDRTLR